MNLLQIIQCTMFYPFQWVANPVNDMYADAVLAGVLQANANPIPLKSKNIFIRFENSSLFIASPPFGGQPLRNHSHAPKTTIFDATIYTLSRGGSTPTPAIGKPPPKSTLWSKISQNRKK